MPMDSEKQTDLKNLASLGCAFRVTLPETPADPEKTILSCLKYFWTDEKLFTMLLGVLTHRIYNLIHVERLVSLAKKIPIHERVLLMVIADKIVRLGDRRFLLIEQKLKNGKIPSVSVPELYSSPYYLEKWGIDPSFQKYKMTVPHMLKEDEKKFFTLKAILLKNPWLKVRALVGTNYRADLIYLKSAHVIQSPAEAYKIMGCERATAYRHWDSLSLIENLEKIIS